MKSNKNKRPNFYNVNLMEVNGEYRILGAEKLQPINQHKSYLKRTNARVLARNLNNGKLVIN